ncbi:MAG: TonB family protein [Candidatus Omnitrophica bacterium]|nr:TonB family protein [Candidatus Omnitrophota bacterium]
MKSFLISVLVHCLIVGVLFFAPGMRRIIYTGDRIQPVYLVKAPKVSFKEHKEEVTFVRRKILLSSPPLEVKSLKEKILERYQGEREKKKPRETSEEKIVKEKSIEAVVRRGASLLLPPNFPYNWYVEILRDKIYTSWSPPSKFSILQEEANAVFSFRVLKDGAIERIRLKRSSKIEILDQSAKKSLESIKSLPPLPDDWKQDHLDVTIRFRVEG